MHSRRPRERSAAVRWALLAAVPALLGALGGSAAAAAQAPLAGVDAGAAPMALREQARRAQRGFEQRRRQLLPLTHGAGDRCDARVGRYCYWYDERSSPGPVEPPRIARERRALLLVLDDAARRLPDDDWLAGQRVRYWVEAGAADTALAAARRCAGTAWWCAALRGMALHAGADFDAAGREFELALATMPARDACRWRDIGMLLDDGDARDRYAELPCEGRGSMEERFWRLSDPFLSRPGNDRRTEHFTRHVLSRLHTDAPSPYTSRWGADLHELLVRYGWPERWSRREPASVASVGPLTNDVIGHEPIPSYRFGPDAGALDAPLGAPVDAWTLRDPAARERYTPTYARQLRALPADVVAFRRGDSLLLAATFRLRGDSVLQRLGAAPVRAALAAAGDTGPPRVSPAAAHTGELGAATLLAPAAPALVGVEVYDDAGRAARWRAAVAPPALAGGVGLSALLLFQAGADADTTLARALAAPIVDGRTPPLPRLGLYWELYGLAPGMHALETTLVVQRAKPGTLRRAWRRLRGAARGAPVHLQWTDVVAVRDGWTPRALQVAIPGLAAGEYAVELRVRMPGGRVLTTTRALVVEHS